MKRPFAFGFAALALFGLTSAFLTLRGPLSAPKGEEEETTGALEALRWRQLALRDENGNIPRDGIRRAMKQREALLRSAQDTLGGPDMEWTERGPFNISGRARSFVINPNNPDHMLVGSVGGGVWITSNGGYLWHPVNDLAPSLAICSLAMAPSDSNIVYAGTGEGFNNIDSILGNGLYKSTDGGFNFERVTGLSDARWINRIAVSPLDPNIVLAAGEGGIYRSIDGGGSFEKVTGTATLANGKFVAFSPDGTHAIASWAYDGNCSAYWSADAGKNWDYGQNQILGVDGRIEMAYAPSNPDIVYATREDTGAVCRSDDGGKTFFKQTADPIPQMFGTQGWYNNAIWVCPTNPDFLLVGGVHLWRSYDAGVTFQQISNGYIGTQQIHPDIHGIFSHPGYDGSSNRTVFVASDGGLFRTFDIENASVDAGWEFMPGPRTTQFYGADGSKQTGAVVGGLQDNGQFRIDPESGVGVRTAGGDGGFIAVDPSNPNVHFGEYVFAALHRSDDNGATAHDIFAGISDVGSKETAPFIAAFALDPDDSNNLFVGTYRIWRSQNAKAGVPNWQLLPNTEGGYVSAVATASPNIVWYGDRAGRVRKSLNANSPTPTWTFIDDNETKNPFPKRYITRIFVDPANSEVVYVCLGGFTADNLWKTIDGGEHWTDISGDLPSVPIRGFTRSPSDPDSLFVGTEIGVFWSYDGGGTWTTSNIAPANVSVDELKFVAGTSLLVAATHGRGIWTADLMTLKSLTLGMPSVRGGNPVALTVELGVAARVGGQVVKLTSNSSILKVPTNLVIPAGASSKTILIYPHGVDADITVTINAYMGNASKQATIIVKPAVMKAVILTPQKVVGGVSDPVDGRVVLDGIAGPTPLLVSLDSSDSASANPASSSVTVLTGLREVSFKVNHSLVGGIKSVLIKGTANGTTAQKTLVVNPIGPSNVILSPFQSEGGTTINGTLVIDGPAPPGGAVFTVSDNSLSATTPAEVTVQEGATHQFFTITTKQVGKITKVKVTARRLGLEASGEFKLLPPAVASLGFNPTWTEGDKGTTGMVTIAKPSAAGGTIVNLSTNTLSASVPTTVTIPEGSSTVSFSVHTTPVAWDLPVEVGATTGGPVVKTHFTLRAPRIASLGFTPATTTGGQFVYGNVTLTSKAPSDGIEVKLECESPSAVVPKKVMIFGGSTNRIFGVNPLPVAVLTTVSVKATLAGQSKTGSFKIAPPRVTYLLINPSMVVGGSSPPAQLQISLSGPAPAGGIVLNLSSSVPGVAYFTGTPRIPGGSTYGSFSVYHNAVLSQKIVALKASTYGSAQTTKLVVKPH
ncbi:MAG: hypothetical protein ACAH95_09920 [Fimbriimonas sp.]